ncbi:MAG: VOC family protein [Thermoplasmata archaeon]
MFQRVDCVRIRVPDLDAGIRFYGEFLGHELAWRRGNIDAGLRLSASKTELVLFTDAGERTNAHPEVDLLVESADQAVRRLSEGGAHVREGPFDLPVGRCAVVMDPFGNELVVLDLSKGLLQTDAHKNVIP